MRIIVNGTEFEVTEQNQQECQNSCRVCLSVCGECFAKLCACALVCAFLAGVILFALA